MDTILQILERAKNNRASTRSKKRINGLHQLTDAAVILYGAGECSHWFHEIAMKRHGIRPVVVIDKRFSGEEWEGIPTTNLEIYQPTQTLKNSAIVVVSVGSFELFEIIKSDLTKFGFKNIVFLRDLYEIHNLFDQPRISAGDWLGFYEDNVSQIEKAYNLFLDEQSREVFLTYLETHVSRIPVPIPMSPREEQYFPKDVPLSKNHAVYVCCGAYDGDTIRLLHETVGKVDKIICFEPEPHIYGRLNQFLLSEGAKLADEIITLPCAVSDHSAQENFIRGDGLGSRISPDGDAMVQCVSLDMALPNVSPTFISMDVEGVELQVLRGAEKLLKRTNPDLGVCVYHAPQQLWEIPLYLSGLELGYRFWLRNYTSYSIETVLYASNH